MFLDEASVVADGAVQVHPEGGLRVLAAIEFGHRPKDRELERVDASHPVENLLGRARICALLERTRERDAMDASGVGIDLEFDELAERFDRLGPLALALVQATQALAGLEVLGDELQDAPERRLGAL